MAHPLANKGNTTSGTVNLPVINPPPSLHKSIQQMGLMEGAASWDRQMGEWTKMVNDALSKSFDAIKQNSST